MIAENPAASNWRLVGSSDATDDDRATLANGLELSSCGNPKCEAANGHSLFNDDSELFLKRGGGGGGSYLN